MSYRLSTSSWDDQERAAVIRVLDSGQITMGLEVQRFEEALAHYLGARHAVATNSGSSANLLAVASLFYRTESAISPGDEVIVPAVGWSTTYSPLQQLGLTPVLVDVDAETLCIDCSAVAGAITNRTRAIMAVNLLGNVADFGRLESLCSERGIHLIEDNCEAMGATYRGRQAGSLGDIGTLSFYYSHHMTTGEGGAVITDDDELADIVRCLRAHGWTRDLSADSHLASKSVEPFYDLFRFVLPGYNVRPTEFVGATGLVQLEKLDQMLDVRRSNASRVLKIVAQQDDLVTQQSTPGGTHSWFGFPLLIKKESQVERQTLVRILAANGIEVRPIVAGNFALSESLAWSKHEVAGSLPVANWVHQQGFFVGNCANDLSQELRHLRTALDAASGY